MTGSSRNCTLNEQRIVAPSFGLRRGPRPRARAAGPPPGVAVGRGDPGPVGGGLGSQRLAAGRFPAPRPLRRDRRLDQGRAPQPPLYRLVPAFLFRWWGRLMFAFLLVVTVMVAFGAGSDDSSSYGSAYGSYGSSGSPGLYGDGSTSVSDLLVPDTGDYTPLFKPWQAWLTLALFALIALCLVAQRDRFVRVLAAELSPERFPDVASDPAEQGEGQRFRWLRDRVRIEQHAPLVMYHEARPFCGAGVPEDTWVLAVELRPDPEKEQRPISNRTVPETIRPLLAQLRLPADYAVQLGRDRLRRLEIDEVRVPARRGTAAA
ncbi:hypothetical protein ACRAWF_34160 [Streptomyces sp. L7]